MYHKVNYIFLIVMQMDERKGKYKQITSPKRLRGPTLELDIPKKRSEALKISIQYKDDGDSVMPQNPGVR